MVNIASRSMLPGGRRPEHQQYGLSLPDMDDMSTCRILVKEERRAAGPSADPLGE